MLKIGQTILPSTLILAPMAGISNSPFRLITREYGCGFAFTEMISASSLIRKIRNTARMLSSPEGDRPLGVQILGRDPEVISRAFDMLSDYSFEIIDFNAACPVNKVVVRGEGAGLLKEPAVLQKLLKIMVGKSNAPVTVKIRSGWDDSSVNAVDVARRVRDSGISGIIIHGRTRAQGYSGSVDYRVIREVKEALDIPVIASGDAFSPVLIKKLFDETGCDGVAIARGALGNPWIFREAEDYLKSGTVPRRPGIDEIAQTMKKHLGLNINYFGEQAGVMLFRKFYGWYTKGLAAKKLKPLAFQAETRAQMHQLIAEIQTLSYPQDCSSPVLCRE